MPSTLKTPGPLLSMLAWLGTLAMAVGCGDSSSGADTASSAETNQGSTNDDSTGGTDTCSDEACEPCVGTDCEEALSCISIVKGRIIFDDGTPMKGSVPICTPQCTVVNSDQYGNFVLDLGPICKTFDFRVDEGIHVTVMYGGGGHAMYTGSFEPTAEELGEEGILDVGTLTLYALPKPVAGYTAEAGVSVDSEGLRFTLPPGALVELEYDVNGDPMLVPVAEAPMSVFSAPLSAWTPPFGRDVEPELLYFVGPYWALLVEPVSVRIDVSGRWPDGTIVHVYMLGEYLSEWGGASDYIYHDQGGACIASGSLSNYITVGEFASCGQATVESGVLETPPMPRLGWYGLKAQ